MIVTIEQIQAGVIKYIDSELAPKAGGLAKFGIYFMAPSIPALVKEKVLQLKATNLMNDVFDDNGNIKLEEVYKRAKDAMSKSGKVYIPQLNYFADDKDIEILYNLIKNS